MYKGFKKLVWILLHSFGRLEWFFVKRIFLRKKPLYPPVFIIGLPRSGTTLFYQLITNYYDVAYITNFENKHYKSPIIAYFLSKVLKKNKKHNSFTSKYGYSSSAFAPSEAGKVWSKWFDKKQAYVQLDSFSHKSRTNFYTFITAWTNIAKKPLVIKNLRFGQRIKLIKELFPNSLFIIVKRNPFFTLQSVYLSRNNMVEDLKDWCTNNKGLCSEDKLILAYNILNQIKETFDKDLKLFTKDRILELNYEDLCDNPQETAMEIKALFTKHNLRITFDELPQDIEIKCSNKVRVSGTLAERLNKIISNDG